MHDAREAGKIAYTNGVTRVECPLTDPAVRKAWLDGWDQAAQTMIFVHRQREESTDHE